MKYWEGGLKDWDFALHDISFANLSMLLASIPNYKSETKEKKDEKLPPSLKDFMGLVD